MSLLEQSPQPLESNNKNKDMSDSRTVYSQWLKRADNVFIPTDNSKTQDKVDPGIYSIDVSQEIGYYLTKKTIFSDELFDLPIPEREQVMGGITNFWDNEDKFLEYGYNFKRGIMLYGVAGSGKSSIISTLCNEIINKHQGVVFTISSETDLNRYTDFIGTFRKIQPITRILTVIEDIDNYCQSKATESTLLNVLDGLEQINNICYIATTNYTEKLSERIIARPNRFDIRIEIRSLNAECRRLYFAKKLKPNDLEAIDLDEWVNKTEGMTIAAMGEVVKSVIILGNTLDETIQRIKNLKIIPNSRNYDQEFSSKIGFGR